MDEKARIEQAARGALDAAVRAGDDDGWSGDDAGRLGHEILDWVEVLPRRRATPQGRSSSYRHSGKLNQSSYFEL